MATWHDAAAMINCTTAVYKIEKAVIAEVSTATVWHIVYIKLPNKLVLV